MDDEDLADLLASWRRMPPTSIALAKIRAVLMVGLRVEEKGAPAGATGDGSADEDTAAWSPEQFEQMAAMMNGRARAAQGAVS